MLRVERVRELREIIRERRAAGSRIAFVPTMGALHDGHLSLVRAAVTMAEEVVVSIFVNPLQFGPSEDFAKYPREFDSDVVKVSQAGARIVFLPATEEIYPERQVVTVTPGPTAALWEGRIRPGHFGGVLTVVAKLFNIVEPDVSVFGQKDFQQATLVRAMVRELNFRTSIQVLPTTRAEDGLALSSRNRYLTPSDRKKALCVPRSLAAVVHAWRTGESNGAALIEVGLAALRDGMDSVDYLSVVSPRSLEPVNVARSGDVVILAARVGTTRLIDNVILDQPDSDALAGAFPKAG